MEPRKQVSYIPLSSDIALMFIVVIFNNKLNVSLEQLRAEVPRAALEHVVALQMAGRWICGLGVKGRTVG